MLPTLETPRLLLRPFRPTDAPTVQQLAGAAEVADTTLHIPHPYPDGAAGIWIASHEFEWDRKSGLTLAIEVKPNRILIGAISLQKMFPTHQAELGYWVGVSYWGNGYATEAAKELIRFAFEDLKLARIHSQHLTRNPASGRVMLKAGMSHEGHRPKHLLRRKNAEDIEIYGILNSKT